MQTRRRALKPGMELTDQASGQVTVGLVVVTGLRKVKNMLMHAQGRARAGGPAVRTRLRLDRRHEDRTPRQGRLTALYNDGFGRRGIAWIDLEDASSDGLGGSCGMDLAPGVLLTVMTQAGARHGYIARCSEGESGCRIGVRFSGASAA